MSMPACPRLRRRRQTPGRAACWRRTICAWTTSRQNWRATAPACCAWKRRQPACACRAPFSSTTPAPCWIASRACCPSRCCTAHRIGLPSRPEKNNSKKLALFLTAACPVHIRNDIDWKGKTMHQPQTPLTPLARAIGGALLMLSLAHMPAMAAEAATPTATPATYHVAGGELSAAIASFAVDARVSVGAAAELLQGLRTQGLSGSYTVPQALAHLLAGTGLEAVPSGERSYVLRKAGTSSSATPIAATLDEVAVSSSALRDGTTEGKRSYAGLTSATRLNLSLRETPQRSASS